MVRATYSYSQTRALAQSEGMDMIDWVIVMETRSPGAIGEFQRQSITVQAPDSDEALRLALHKFHDEGLETRFPVSVREQS